MSKKSILGSVRDATAGVRPSKVYDKLFAVLFWAGMATGVGLGGTYGYHNGQKYDFETAAIVNCSKDIKEIRKDFQWAQLHDAEKFNSRRHLTADDTISPETREDAYISQAYTNIFADAKKHTRTKRAHIAIEMLKYAGLLGLVGGSMAGFGVAWNEGRILGAIEGVQRVIRRKDEADLVEL